jgi:hypothetical protein
MERHRWDPVCERPSGLVVPARIGTTDGPTRGQARGPGWVRCAPGWWVPRERPTCVEQHVLEQAARLPDSGAVTGWAALRWRGGAFFDGSPTGGTDWLPVPLLLGGGNLRPHPRSTISRERFPPGERTVVAGLPLATVQRAVFDEMRRVGSLLHAVQTIEMAAAAALISVALMTAYVVPERNGYTGVPLVRRALGLAINDSRSPRETWLRLVWLSLGLPPPVCNRPVFDRGGRLLGCPDLFDPVAGLVGEYDGAEHKGRERHRRDVAREELFRDHGLEYFAVVAGDSREVATARMVAARGRARFLPPDRCAWTLQPPSWWPVQESLDARLARLGLVPALTHA